jgi:hypothetical protein
MFLPLNLIRKLPKRILMKAARLREMMRKLSSEENKTMSLKRTKQD